MNRIYSFSVFNDLAHNGITQALTELNPQNLSPIFICIGSDLVLGDSLGPLVGTFLKRRNHSAYIYGTLNTPITAKEVGYARTYTKQMHPNSITIAIDAAVGDADDVGLIRTMPCGLRPGLGVDKKLDVVGDLSIIGIVAGRSNQNKSLFSLTRLNLVYSMAEKIAQGISDYLTIFEQGHAPFFQKRPYGA